MAENSIFNLIPLVLLVFVVLSIYDFYKKRRFLVKNIKNVPILSYVPWFGSCYRLLEVIHSSIHTVEKMNKLMNNDHYVAYIGHMPIYFTTDPHDYEVILPNILERGIFYTFADDNLESKTLLSLRVSHWKIIRRIMSRSFKERSLNSMIPFINESAERHFSTFSAKETGRPILAKSLRFVVEGFLFNFFPYFKLDGERSYTRIAEALHALILTPYKRFIRPWLFPKMFYDLTPMKKDVAHKNLLANIDAQKAIDRTRQGRIEGTIDLETEDIIANLERAGTEDNVILAEFKVMTGAASHTTSVVFCALIMALGIYPEYQEKIFEEVMKVVGPTGPVDKGHIQELTFTNMFVKEVLRFFPSVPVIMRQTTEELTLRNGKVFPKGMDICMSLYSLHRNERYWDKPLEFNPYRFLPEEVEKRHPFAYLPFSTGPRNCIGYKYAMNVLMISASHFARKYVTTCSYKSINDIEMKSYMIMEMVDNNPVCTFTPRQLDAAS